MFRAARCAIPRWVAVVAVAALIPVLAGCDAGNNAPVLNFHQPTDGAETTVQQIKIRNVFVLGPELQNQIKAGQSAGVFFGLVNNGTADKLISITAPGTAASVKLPGGVVSLGYQQAVLLTGPTPQVILEHLTRPLMGGESVRLVMTFQKAGTVTLDVPVVARAQFYSTYSPAPAPSKKAKPKVTVGASATATPAVSASPTPSS